MMLATKPSTSLNRHSVSYNEMSVSVATLKFPEFSCPSWFEFSILQLFRPRMGNFELIYALR